MAPPPGTLRVGRYFAALIVLLGLLYLVAEFPGARHTPKLGIDLVGGKRVIFTARTGNGTAPTTTAMSQARQIIEDRINGTGVTGATVQVQGGNQLVVLIPGGTDTDVAALGQPAVLNFRPLVAPAAAVTCIQPTPGGTASPSPSPTATGSAGASPTKTPTSTATQANAQPSGTASEAPNGLHQRPLTARTTAAAKTPTTAKSVARTSPAAKTPTAATSAPASSAAPTPCVKNPLGTILKADPKLKIPTTETAYAALTATQQQEVQAALANFDCSAALDEPDQPDRYYLACDDGKSYGVTVAYLLGTVIVKGSEIDNASAQAPSVSGNGGPTDWTVALNLKSSGSKKWASWTSKYNINGADTSSSSALQCSSTGTQCSDYVGFTLNGRVISAPVTVNAINGGTTQISGGFVQSTANDLAQQLNYGSLPLSFRTDANESVSATLGNQQLKAAFLAGGIGLVLVVLYSLAYYRGLGLVTIASLLVSAGLTYAMLVILGTQIGFTLDLAGIAGFIVALGITADSFVVFFERIKDEVHEGRSMRVAVPRAWIRARRTILSADTVSFLAAAILYYFAAADVKGFAFTLGLSTILDLVVVFLFTHPIVSLLSRSRTFGSPRFTGLNSVRSGGIVPDEPAPRRPRGGARTSARDTGRGATAMTAPPASGAVDVVDEDEPATRPTGGSISRAGGSAAERAAARRARLRPPQSTEGETDTDGDNTEGRS